jgi:hypothetical protein
MPLLLASAHVHLRCGHVVGIRRGGNGAPGPMLMPRWRSAPLPARRCCAPEADPPLARPGGGRCWARPITGCRPGRFLHRNPQSAQRSYLEPQMSGWRPSDSPSPTLGSPLGAIATEKFAALTSKRGRELSCGCWTIIAKNSASRRTPWVHLCSCDNPSGEQLPRVVEMDR